MHDKPKRQVVSFMHCGACLKEKPEDQSAEEYARLSCGVTEQGFQVWCLRHDINILHIDMKDSDCRTDTTIHGDFRTFDAAKKPVMQ